MTEYEEGLPVLVAFPPETARSLAQAFSEAGWRQFHVAETEKYAHVTYFFNGGIETPWPGEDRELIPSPKVATYDLQPSMSAPGVTDALVAAIASGSLRLHRRELRQPGHGRPHRGTGTRRSRRSPTIDACLARVVDAVEAVEAADPDGPGALLAITADHGNADDLRDAAGAPVTAHSLNPVPFVLIGRSVAGRRSPTASSPTSRRRSSSWPTCHAWPAITGRSLLRR